MVTKTKVELQKVFIRLDPELWKAVKSKAALQGKTLQDFVTETLEKSVK